MPRSLFALLLAATLLTVGCPADTAPPAPPAPPTADAPTADAPTADAPTADAPTADAPKADGPVAAASAEAPVYDVVCGCKVPDVKRCGDYAVVEGKHVPISGLNMGAMPFCGKTGLKAKIDGTVVDGTLEATGFTYTK